MEEAGPAGEPVGPAEPAGAAVPAPAPEVPVVPAAASGAARPPERRMQVALGLFAVGLVSLVVAIGSNRPAPGYIAVGCAAAGLVWLAWWPRLAGLGAPAASGGQASDRVTSSQTGVPSDSSA